MPTKTMRLCSPGQRYSTRRLVNKLNHSDTLSKDLITRAFLKAPKLATSVSSSHSHDDHQTDHLLVSQSSFQTAPSTDPRSGDQQEHHLLSESFASFISIDNGLGSPTRRPIHSPRRSPRRTLSSSSPTKRKKPLLHPKYQQQLQPRLCDSCPEFDRMSRSTAAPKIPLVNQHDDAIQQNDTKKNNTNEQDLPELDAALGKESIRHIESHKRFFHERRPNRRKVKFEAVKEVPTVAATHILHLSVSDLQLPVVLAVDTQDCSRALSRTKQFEIIRELERDLRAATRQVQRFDEMIEYEAEIVQELEHENLVLRRRILEFPNCLPSRSDLRRQIQEVEAMVQQTKGVSTNAGGSAASSHTITVVRRRIDNV